MKNQSTTEKQNENPASASEKTDNKILCANIKKMAELLKDNKRANGEDGYRIEDACKDLGITYTSFKRWEKEPERLIAKRSLTPLYKSYTNQFLPQLSKDTDLITQDITGELQLINSVSVDFFKIFFNTYYVYYYSDHFSEEIHFGRLRLHMDGEEVCAKLVIGIPREQGLHDKALDKIFEKEKNSFEEFKTYRKNLQHTDERNCYYYYGKAAISGPMLLLTLFGRNRNNKENDHKLLIMINIKKILDRQAETPDGRPYIGGMSMVVSMPNSKHPSLRIFRMGISKWEIPPSGLELFSPMLRHNQEVNQRIVMSETDDRAWYHSISRYEII